MQISKQQICDQYNQKLPVATESKVNDDVAELNYDPTYGIGKLYYNIGSPSWHYRSYGKAYFDLISRKKVPLRLEKGEILHCRGGYKFYRKVEN
ncbi:Uncharacterised protein [Enterococcus hirae]|uniref:hypothetical protein n=1 Tax=Enterococcus hirae TaxID=1354 RepID=UPI0010DAF2D5|nr:hypothetical protein [Enterococcus hirae]VTS78079.1 Uncharacterised protein [Enterococcus hirae]